MVGTNFGPAVLVVLACVGGSVAANGAVGERRPACKVQLVAPDPRLWPTQEVRVKAGGREVSLGKVKSLPQDLVVHPAGADEVFVAYVGQNEHGPYGGDTLWQISCKAPRAEVFTRIQDADFGHSALSSDRKTLLFTGADGIFALDLK